MTDVVLSLKLNVSRLVIDIHTVIGIPAYRECQCRCSETLLRIAAVSCFRVYVTFK